MVKIVEVIFEIKRMFVLGLDSNFKDFFDKVSFVVSVINSCFGKVG